MENTAKWYAVQQNSADGWDNGSADFETAKAMLKKQGAGLIAVIENGDFCTEEIRFDDLFDMDDFSDDDLAEIVRNADVWTDDGCADALSVLCERAGDKLREMTADGEDCTEIFTMLRESVGSFLDGTPDVSDDTPDVIDWLRDGAEQAEIIHLCYALQEILDITLIS